MFIPVSNKDGARIPYEYLPCGAITPKLGMALVQSGGNLAVATGENTPTYISMYESDAALTAGTEIPVIRVDKETVFKTTLGASGTSLKLGDKVTILNGMQVSATTTGGVAEIIAFCEDSKASGAEVRVRF